MTTQFFCKNRDRWKRVKASGTVNGIDYLEVASTDQKTLNIYFLHNLPGEPGGIPTALPLQKENVFIEGGVRFKNIVAENVTSNANVLTVTVSTAGDFSGYILKIAKSSTEKDTPPAGIDEQLSTVNFSFKIDCPNEFDCKTEVACPPDKVTEPAINYLAKDYASFNRLMLDRLSVVMPDWRERNAADLQVALIELLAYVGDHLSYYQDAVGTEAYLNTARRRVSLKRHARLLDYFVHDGCNARAWVFVETERGGSAENMPLPKGSILMTGGNGKETAISLTDKEKFISDRSPVVFETMHPVTLSSAHNSFSFYTWEDRDCCLPKGSTSATLRYHTSISLKKGDVLIFEELYGPLTGKKRDADPLHRHAVRIQSIQTGLTDSLTGTKLMRVDWFEADALPFPLCLTSPVENEDAELPLNEKSVARGNIVLADQGISLSGQTLFPAIAFEKETYYPELTTKGITVAAAYSHESAMLAAAGTALQQNPQQALPVVSLSDAYDVWTNSRDLLQSDRFAPEFVVEMEQDGTAYLRFGDDISGRKVLNGFSPEVALRVGNGKSGNVGVDAINTVLLNSSGIKKIRNPLPADGGTDPETMEEVRQFAPQAFRRQERAVTEADYVSKTELHPEVQKAAARFYWTGSWYTVYIIIDRRGGKEMDEGFKQEMRKHLEQYRMAGYDLEIRPPHYVPVQIILNICVKPGYFKNDVKEDLLRVFSNYDLPDGTQGFFHPDHFTFGQPLYLSALYEKAMEVTGVASVEIKTFQRWAKNSAGEIESGLLQPSGLEILRLDNDPSLPENGRIDFIMLGGL